jgi:catechol 2,3-dioxygenase
MSRPQSRSAAEPQSRAQRSPWPARSAKPMIAFCYHNSIFSIPSLSRDAVSIKQKKAVKTPDREDVSMIKPKLHHVTFKTSRLDEMLSWYGLVIGAQIQFRDQVAAWTTNDAANHRIAFLAVPGLDDDPRKVDHNGVHHTAFEYDNADDLMSSYDRLRKVGIEPAFCLDHGLTMSLYYKDPEGNYVELQSDNFSDWNASSEWMRTSPDFAANPIGTFFDPARVYDALRSGADFRVLQKSIRAGAYLPDPIPGIGLPTP